MTVNSQLGCRGQQCLGEQNWEFIFVRLIRAENPGSLQITSWNLNLLYLFLLYSWREMGFHLSAGDSCLSQRLIWALQQVSNYFSFLRASSCVRSLIVVRYHPYPAEIELAVVSGRPDTSGYPSARASHESIKVINFSVSVWREYFAIGDRTPAATRNLGFLGV